MKLQNEPKIRREIRHGFSDGGQTQFKPIFSLWPSVPLCGKKCKTNPKYCVSNPKTKIAQKNKPNFISGPPVSCLWTKNAKQTQMSNKLYIQP
jgi:hypothetical protein